MPIYEYGCQCGHRAEIVLPVDKRNDPQICPVCNLSMQRQISIPMPAIFKRTGRSMALDTLNSGHATPDRWYKSKAEKLAASGLDESRPVRGRGFGG